MTSPSKRKGNSFEREIVNLAKDWGFPSQRAYASNGESLGLHAEVDCTIGKDKITIQCKRRKKIASFLKCENTDVVIFREDRGESLVLMPIDFFLTLLKKIEG